MNAPAAAMPASQRCAPRAARRHDWMLGTAFPAARLLLVEQPYPWGPEGLRSSHFAPDIALALEARCREQGIRVQAIRRSGRGMAEPRPRRWALVDTRRSTRAVVWGEFVQDAELLELALDGSTGTPDPEPLYLVCSHGLHDPCCAGRGRPVTVALGALRPEQVWQTSHLGGCRFAATVLTLPLGVMYGHVTASSAPAIVAATEAGEVIAPLLRGRIGVPPAAQAALGYAQQQLGLPHADDLTLLSTTVVDRQTVQVRLSAGARDYEVTVSRQRVDADTLTCATPGPNWFVAHHPVAIAPL